MADSDELVPFDPLYPNFGHVDPDNPFLRLFAARMGVRHKNKTPSPTPPPKVLVHSIWFIRAKVIC